jgi:PIN domain nuclease of toxin-antitoxin system
VKALLDTSVVVWAASEAQKLSAASAKILQHADVEIIVSCISCGELACAQQRRRIQLDRHWKLWFQTCLQRMEWTCLPVTLDIIEEAYSLPEPFHTDPADRILVATARLNHCTLVTADRKLLDYPHVKTLW